jgi:hypothetical protein
MHFPYLHVKTVLFTRITTVEPPFLHAWAGFAAQKPGTAFAE